MICRRVVARDFAKQEIIVSWEVSLMEIHVILLMNASADVVKIINVKEKELVFPDAKQIMNVLKLNAVATITV